MKDSKQSLNAQNKPLTIWTMTSGAQGMRSQVNGLANAIAKNGIDQIIEKTIELKPWSKWLPGHWNPAALYSLTSSSCALTPPWPDILITSGRRSSAASIAIGKASNAKTYRVHIQNPQTPSHYFDLICSMKHDALTGSNVIQTKTALHKLTHDKLAQEKAIWSPIWDEQFKEHGQSPVLAILLGGKNKKFGFNQEKLDHLVKLIQTARSKQDANILITPSGRTEPFVITALNTQFKNDPNIWIWDQSNNNPYHGILAYADHIMVTADSVSMISEALYTSKPVHILPLSGTSRRHQIFLDILSQDKLIHPITQTINFSVEPTRDPIDETKKIAHTIRQNYQNHIKNIS